MAVPRNRHSNARKKSKRSHNAKPPRSLAICSQCGKYTLPHCACSSCNTYRKRSINVLQDASSPQN